MQFGAVWAADCAYLLTDWGKKVGREVTAADAEILTWALAEMGQSVTAADLVTAVTEAMKANRAAAQWWAPAPDGDGFDLLLTPTLGEPPVAHGTFDSTPDNPLGGFFRSAAFVPFTAQFNVSGQPAINLPLHWNDEGLPIGIQLVARSVARTCCCESQPSSRPRSPGSTAAHPSSPDGRRSGPAGRDRAGRAGPQRRCNPDRARYRGDRTRRGAATEAERADHEPVRAGARGSGAGRRREGCRAFARRRALPRRAVPHQGPGDPDGRRTGARRHARVEGSGLHRARHESLGPALAGSRIHHPGPDEHARARDHADDRARGVRSVAQPVGHGTDDRWFERWVRRRSVERDGARRARE